MHNCSDLLEYLCVTFARVYQRDVDFLKDNERVFDYVRRLYCDSANNKWCLRQFLWDECFLFALLKPTQVVRLCSFKCHCCNQSLWDAFWREESLTAAASCNNILIVEMLTTHAGSYEDTLCALGSGECFQTIMRRRFNVAFLSACSNGGVAIVSYLCKFANRPIQNRGDCRDKNGDNCAVIFSAVVFSEGFLVAARKGHLDVCQFLWVTPLRVLCTYRNNFKLTVMHCDLGTSTISRLKVEKQVFFLHLNSSIVDAFVIACTRGHVVVARWAFERIGLDYDTAQMALFRAAVAACTNHHPDAVKLIRELCMCQSCWCVTRLSNPDTIPCESIKDVDKDDHDKDEHTTSSDSIVLPLAATSAHTDCRGCTECVECANTWKQLSSLLTSNCPEIIGIISPHPPHSAEMESFDFDFFMLKRSNELDYDCQ